MSTKFDTRPLTWLNTVRFWATAAVTLAVYYPLVIILAWATRKNQP